MNSTQSMLCSCLVGALLLAGSARADLGLWQGEVAAGVPAVYSETNIVGPTTRDIGALSGDKTYEFIVNASALGGSSALIGVRGSSPNQGIKFEQWYNSMRYGVTQFGAFDLAFPGIWTDFDVDVHLAFTVDSGSNLTTLYVNGVMISSLNFTVNLSGWVGVGQTAFPVLSDPLDGTIIGIATYDSALSDAEIQNHADAYYTLPVEIDIKPGSDPNCFNVNGHGVIPVAINGTDDFDPTWIDMATLDFGGLAVNVRGNGLPQCSFHDWNDDGWDDLVCQFEDDSDLWAPGDGQADLTGELFDGTLIKGTDAICIRP